MSRATRTILSALAIACLAVLPIVATEEIGKQEGVKCKACHDKVGSKLLRHKGKYYEYKRTLEGYDRILRKFKKCTLCHVSTPGSMDLTTTGKQLKNRNVTMEHVSAPDRPRDQDKKKDEK